jgi:hypothetical protein
MINGGRKAGQAHVAALGAYLDGLRHWGQNIPQRAGKVNFTAVTRSCGFNREVLYQNPRCKALLATATASLASTGGQPKQPPDEAEKGRAFLERRIAKLERQNVALYDEVHELRRQLKRHQAIEAVLVESGRREIPWRVR